MRRQSVYFIKPIGMAGPVKIGCAAIAKERVHQLAVAVINFQLELAEQVPALLVVGNHRAVGWIGAAE